MTLTISIFDINFRAWSKKYMGHIDKLLGYIEEIMEDHKANFDENNIGDYIGKTCEYCYYKCTNHIIKNV